MKAGIITQRGVFGMRNERKGQDKKQMLQAAKENSDLVEFIKSLTKEEVKWIKEQREFETIKPGTWTYKIAVVNDAIRSNIRQLKSKLNKRLWNIEDITNKIERLNEQLRTGEIYECVKDGMTMTKEELTNFIQHHEWLRKGEVDAIPMNLAEIRALVGHKDVARQVVMTVEEFDKMVGEVYEKLKAKGYDIFSELEA